MKRFLIIFLVMCVVAGGRYFFIKNAEAAPVEATNKDALNTTYTIDGQAFVLVDGEAENEIAPGAASKDAVSVYGEPATGSVNPDREQGIAVILVRNSGGSGTFYYAAISTEKPGVYSGSEGVLLGDRIADADVEVSDNRAKYMYLDRAYGESFDVDPSIETERHFQLRDGNMAEVEVNFEGGADPNIMTLGMKTWDWQKTAYNSDKVVEPATDNAFTLAFNEEDSTYSAGTDCNGIGGTYESEGSSLSFNDDGVSTLMFCEESQEAEYKEMLMKVQSYLFTTQGQLILEMEGHAGSMIFK